MVLYGLNENLRSYKSLKKGANFRLSPALRGGVLVGFWLGVCYCHRKPEAYHSVICSCQSSNSYLSLFEGIPFSHLIGG